MQKYEWNYQPTARGMNVSRRDENPNVNPLLEQYGLEVDDDILMDVNTVPMSVQTSANPLASAMGMGTTVEYPIQILVNNSTMDQETSITSRLSSIFYLWGTALDLNEEKLAEHGIDVQRLMWTTEQAWKWPKTDTLSQEAVTPPEEGAGPFPLMVMASGQFPDAYAEQERPSWPAPQPQPGQPPQPPPQEEPAAEVEPAPAKLVLLGCSEMFRRDFLQAANLDLFMNSVDAVTLGDDLVHIRGRKPIDRVITRPRPSVQQTWKVINYGVPPVVVAAIGIAVGLIRRRSRNAYTMAYAAAHD